MSRYSYQSYSLKDRVVLITGATSGIGESCAWRFANEGAKLILLGRRGERLDKVKEEIQVVIELLRISLCYLRFGECISYNCS